MTIHREVSKNMKVTKVIPYEKALRAILVLCVFVMSCW
jgi:hypothetical protein